MRAEIIQKKMQKTVLKQGVQINFAWMPPEKNHLGVSAIDFIPMATSDKFKAVTSIVNFDDNAVNRYIICGVLFCKTACHTAT